MKKLLPLLMFLTFSGFRPVAVTTQSAKGINENFNSLASEIERRSLNQGGIVHQNLKISSSAHVTGDVVIDGDVKATEITVSTLTATVGAVITIGCPVGFIKIGAQSRVLGCMQIAEEGTATWDTATIDCFDTYGGTLPEDDEFHIAITNYALDDETDDEEWTSDSGWHSTTALGHLTRGSVLGLGDDSGSKVYRCWIPAAALLLN